MEPIKHIQYTKIIKAGGQLREFNFRKSNGPTGPYVSIDVADSRGERHYIRFVKVNNKWEIGYAQLLSWIHEAFPQLEEAINENS